MEFAQNLKSVMDSKSITMYRLAKELGVHQTTVKNWLEGKGEPRISEVQSIAAALGVDSYSLYSFDQASEAIFDRINALERIECDCNRLNDDGVKLVAEVAHLAAEAPRYRLRQHPPAPPEGTDTTPAAPPPESTEKGG